MTVGALLVVALVAKPTPMTYVVAPLAPVRDAKPKNAKRATRLLRTALTSWIFRSPLWALFRRTN